MIAFTHDFSGDLSKIYTKGEPYALIRFGDGERAFCTKKPLKVTDNGQPMWSYDGTDTMTSRRVRRAITANIPGLYLGISCPCCDKKAYEWYMHTVTCPPTRLTYANIFVNANYAKFRTLDLKDTVLVSCKNGDFTIPEDCLNPIEWDYQPLLKELLKVDKTILISMGPMKCGLIYDYWLQATNKQIILDVGSAMDWRIHGRPTRSYHTPGTTCSQRTCVWGS